MKGKTVRYNEDGLRYAKSSLHSHHSNVPPWSERTGVVLRLTKKADSACVIWSGNRTFAEPPIPLRFLEVVS